MSIILNGIDQPSTINTVSTVPHGTYHMADNPAMYEPQRLNNFEFMVTGLGSKLLKSGYNTETAALTPNNAYIKNPEAVIRLSVKSMFVPHFSQNPIEIKRGNSTLKYAGTPTFGDGSLTINDYIGTDAKMALMAWQNQSYNVTTEKVGLAKDYKHDCYLLEYTPDFQLVRTWKLYGCWISGLQEQTFDYDSQNGVNNITATIQYDKAMPDTSDLLD